MIGPVHLLLVFLILIVSNASSAGNGDIGRATEIFEILRSIAPTQSLQCAIDKVQATVMPDAYSDDESVRHLNIGIKTRIQRLLTEDACFAETAKKFWSEVETFAPGTAQTSNGLEELSSPSLADRAGEGRFANQPVGWLWKKAIASTGGNARAAIDLIAMCTHDNSRTSLRFERKLAYDHEAAEVLNKLYQQIESLRNALRKIEPSELEAMAVREEINRLQTEISIRETRSDASSHRKVEERIDCPSEGSGVYAPRALDSSQDIPDRLKQKIAQVQRPNGKVSDLPAKAYHFFGGALLGCQLIQCGMSLEKSARIAELLGIAYRSVRLCPDIRKFLNARNHLGKELKISPDSPKFSDALISQYKDLSLRPLVQLGIVPLGYEFSQLPPEQKVRQIRLGIQKMDAAILYSRWYLGGPNFLSENTPCTPIRIGGPTDINAPEPGQPNFRIVTLGNHCNSPSWDRERCSSARLRLSTWDVDYEWTSEQHRIGALFGATQCRAAVPSSSQTMMCGTQSKPTQEQAKPNRRVQ